MTNNEIIFETVRNTFTPAQLAELVQATYTAEQIAARRANITAKIAGGARMFEISGGSIGNIGQRNIESVRQILRMEKIPLLWEDVGGTIARTMEFDSATGTGTIRSYGHPDVSF